MPSYSPLCALENAHDDGIWAVTWTHPNKLVTGSLDYTVRSWTVDTQLTPGAVLRGHELGVIAVSPEGNNRQFVSSSLDSRIKVWVSQGEGYASRTTIEGGPVEVWTVAHDPNGPRVATGTHAGNIVIYNTDSGEKEQTLETKGKFIMSVAYSKQGGYLASGSESGAVHVFDVASGRLVATLTGHNMPVRSLSFSPDGRFLVSASDDKRIHMYDVAHSSLVAALSGHSSWVLSVAWAPTTSGSGPVDHVASGSSDKKVKLWDIRGKSCLHTFDGHADQVWGVAYNEDGTRLASVSDDKSIRIYSCK